MYDTAKDRLIVGLDLPSVQAAEALVDKLSDHVTFYKIGYQLAFCGGLELAKELVAAGKRVFLDLKLLDIDNTIAAGVESIIKTGVSMLTLHAYPKAMRVAVEAAHGSELCLLGVTVLTSMDQTDLVEAGYHLTPEELVLKRALQAKQCGMGGVVASAAEAQMLRQAIGEEMAIVTPGIRPLGSDTNDQKRVMTPAKAMQAGASHLVVARPIIKADDPLTAAIAIITEMQSAIGQDRGEV